jgi:hypothetical protein
MLRSCFSQLFGLLSPKLVKYGTDIMHLGINMVCNMSQLKKIWSCLCGKLSTTRCRPKDKWGIVPGILNLYTRWRRVISFMPWPLYPQERASSVFSLGNWFGPRPDPGGEEKREIFCPSQKSNPASFSLVTKLTELFRLNFINRSLLD